MVGVPHRAHIVRWAMWHAMSAEDACAKLDVDAAHGLTAAEAAARLLRYGSNELPESPPVPWWKLVLQQFDDLLVKMLLAAAVVSFILALAEGSGNMAHAMVEPSVIMLILVLNAIVGVWQESSAEKAIDALKAYEPNEAEVRRDGAPFRTLRAPDLVPGDIVRLSVGARAPADVRLVELNSTTLRADQAILTGESEPSIKEPELVADPPAEIQARGNIVFSGTTISCASLPPPIACAPQMSPMLGHTNPRSLGTRPLLSLATVRSACRPSDARRRSLLSRVADGAAVGVVVETGARTEMGLIGEQVASTQQAATPLKLKLDEFGETLSKVARTRPLSLMRTLSCAKYTCDSTNTHATSQYTHATPQIRTRLHNIPTRLPGPTPRSSPQSPRDSLGPAIHPPCMSPPRPSPRWTPSPACPGDRRHLHPPLAHQHRTLFRPAPRLHHEGRHLLLQDRRRPRYRKLVPARTAAPHQPLPSEA